MEKENNYIQSIGACIKCHDEKAGSTPWLCIQCFKLITFEWIKFNYTGIVLDNHIFENKLKSFRNKVQKLNRRAFKKENTKANI